MMNSRDSLIKVEDIGKHFILTKDFVSKLVLGAKVLKAVDHVSFHMKKGAFL